MTIIEGLVIALIAVESGGKNVITFHDGHSPSYGCAQIKLRTAKEIDPSMSASDLFDCKKSAVLAGKYLQTGFNKYGNWRRALCRYNTGKPLNDCKYARKVFAKWLATDAPNGEQIYEIAKE